MRPTSPWLFATGPTQGVPHAALPALRPAPLPGPAVAQPFPGPGGERRPADPDHHHRHPYRAGSGFGAKHRQRADPRTTGPAERQQHQGTGALRTGSLGRRRRPACRDHRLQHPRHRREPHPYADRRGRTAQRLLQRPLRADPPQLRRSGHRKARGNPSRPGLGAVRQQRHRRRGELLHPRPVGHHQGRQGRRRPAEGRLRVGQPLLVDLGHRRRPRRRLRRPAALWLPPGPRDRIQRRPRRHRALAQRSQPGRRRQLQPARQAGLELRRGQPLRAGLREVQERRRYRPEERLWRPVRQGQAGHPAEHAAGRHVPVAQGQRHPDSRALRPGAPFPARQPGRRSHPVEPELPVGEDRPGDPRVLLPDHPQGPAHPRHYLQGTPVGLRQPVGQELRHRRDRAPAELRDQSQAPEGHRHAQRHRHQPGHRRGQPARCPGTQQRLSRSDGEDLRPVRPGQHQLERLDLHSRPALRLHAHGAAHHRRVPAHHEAEPEHRGRRVGQEMAPGFAQVRRDLRLRPALHLVRPIRPGLPHAHRQGAVRSIREPAGGLPHRA